MLTIRSQIKETHLVGKCIHGCHIALDVIPLGGKLLLEIVRESLFSSRDAVNPPVFMAIELIHTVGINRTNPDLVVKTEIAEDTVEGTAGLESAQHVHARVKGNTIAAERLQTATRTRTALQNSHLVPFLA